jgi:hypothetical protein
LDINFDCEDFFNQFDPTTVAKPVAKKVESTPAPVIPDSGVGMMKFGNNVPIVEEKPKNNLDEYNSKKQTYTTKLSNTDDDVQARYEALVKSGATAIGSEMLFGQDEQPKDEGSAGRWSTPASLAGFGEKLQDHI